MNPKRLQADPEPLVALLGQMAGKRIVVIGDMILDVYFRGRVERVSPEAPIPVVEITDPDSRSPGGAANVAVNVAALGGDACAVGAVGKDLPGEELRRQLERRKVCTREMLSVAGRPTTEKTRVLANNQQVLRIDRENGADLSGPDQDRLIAKAITAIRKADAVIFEDYNKGVLTPNVIRRVIAAARDRGLIIAVDPKYKNFFAYRNVSVIKPNLKEVSAALGASISCESIHRVGAEVLRRLNCAAMLLTRSERGMTLFQRGGKPMTIPTVAREVFDVSGAGDTVIAVLTLALAAGGTLVQAAALANYAAGLQVQRRGAVAITAKELKARLLEENR